MTMEPDARIAGMRRRIQRWLSEDSRAGRTGDDGTLEGLDADIAALEEQLETLFPNTDSASEPLGDPSRQAVLRTVLDSMVEGVIVADMEGRMLVFNQAARDLLGRGPADTATADWSAEYGLFHADGETPCSTEELPLSRSLRGEEVDHEVLVVRTPERPNDCHVSTTARPLRDENARQIGALVVFHDVTATREVEQELRRARVSADETAQAKGAFLANMSHEIRTPLTAVLGFTDLLLDPHLNESEKLNYIQSVRRNGEHLLALINDVLDLSKINAGQIRVESIDCSLQHVLHEVASVMRVRAHDKGIGFELALDTPIPARIHSDPMRVRQILFNLVGNAIKFTHEGGVRLTARCLDVGTREARIEFAVTDTGIGMSAEEIEGLFVPFQQANPTMTRRYGGTGLGLTICRSLAEALDGEIGVDSTPGQGSTFTLTLYHPLDEHTEMITQAKDIATDRDADRPGAEEVQHLKGRILLAEDGLDNQILIATILRRHGLDVEIADNGESAVTMALSAYETGAPFDVILMDMQMPRLDGYGATATLRRKGYSGPIIALTAHAMAGERERCLAAGCDDYLSKPIDRPALLAAIASHLHRIQGGGAGSVGINPAGPDEEPAHSTGPIHSRYADDPDMAELVASFVERLPLQIHDIRLAAHHDDLEVLRRLAHQLKGAAGGYGFMPVSAAAAALEASTRDARQASDVAPAVDHLAQTCDRVRRGAGQKDAEA